VIKLTTLNDGLLFPNLVGEGLATTLPRCTLDALTCSGGHYSELFDVLLQQVDKDLFVSRCAMSRAFNAVMRVISSLIGVLMILMGGIWILQGLNLAWGSLSRSFMQGDCRSVSGRLEQHPSTGMRSVDHTGDRN
jgi:hypothetical protein